MKATFAIIHLGPDDIDRLRRLNALFGKVFAEPGTYQASPPSDAYLRRLLLDERNLVLAAHSGDEVVGGLVAYQLDKFEQERSEIYIYDLAVAEHRRREGIATALIGRLGDIAAERSAWVIYVQADYGDDPAIALYEKLGTREEVLHFDIAVDRRHT
jgi:aminoglycoside 3-N-acetyltransferase I